MPARANTAAPPHPHHNPPAPIANPATVDSAHKPASRSRRSGVGSAPARRNMRSRPFRGVRSGSSLTARTVPPPHRHPRVARRTSARRGPWSRAGRPGTTRHCARRHSPFRSARRNDDTARPCACRRRAGRRVELAGRFDAHLVGQDGHDPTHLLAVLECDHRPTPDVVSGPGGEGLGDGQRMDSGKEQQLGPVHVANPGDHLLVEQGGPIEMERRLSLRPSSSAPSVGSRIGSGPSRARRSSSSSGVMSSHAVGPARCR